MPHVLVAGKLHPSGLALLDGAKGVTYRHVEEISVESYAPLIGEADALILRTQPLDGATLARAGRLKIVSRHGVGCDAVDVGALNRRGIPLAIVGDVNSVSVAEHAMTLLLASFKRVVRGDRAVREGGWGWRNRLEVREAAGKRLLVVGFGRIGRRLAAMAFAFGMEVRAHDPVLQERGWPEGEVAPFGDLKEGLAWADAVSLHAPGTGKRLLGADEIAAMKPGAVLVNTARGGSVDEAALVEALRSGHLGAAGLDVFADEPPPKDHPLFALDQAVLSPHAAGISAESAQRMAVACVQNVLDFYAGTLDPALVVNRDAIDG